MIKNLPNIQNEMNVKSRDLTILADTNTVRVRIFCKKRKGCAKNTDVMLW